MRRFFPLLALVAFLSGCAPGLPAPLALFGPKATPTDCGCSVEGTPFATPTGGFSAQAGPAAPGGAAAPATPLPLESLRDRWQTYTSDAYHFSFEYPLAYTSPEFAFCDVRAGGPASQGAPQGAEFTLSLGSRTVLSVTKTSGSLDAAAAALKAGLPDAQFDQPKTLSVGGVPAVTLPYHSGGTNRYGEATLFVKDGLLYRIDEGVPSACDISAIGLRELDAYTRMLESFRFQN